MIVTVLVSTGAAWEAEALAALNGHPGIAVLKRCVDVDDLLATASAGQVEVAVVGTSLPGFDRAVLDQLDRYGVRVVAVVADDGAAARARAVGWETVVVAPHVDDLVNAVGRAPASTSGQLPLDPPGAAGRPSTPHPPVGGQVIAVWGPNGAPGRTTLAIAIAAELAERRVPTVLIDADPYGGAVAQHLGILDDASGLLAAARLVASRSLDDRLAGVQRAVSDHLRVVTGLPRADRRSEVRAGALTAVVSRARVDARVVLDTGFSLERDPMAELEAQHERNALTLEALDLADEIMVVGSADPTGLARLARAITEIHEVQSRPPVRIVVNRMRRSLGWHEDEVARLLAGFGATGGVHFLPDDQAAADRAALAGQTLVESGDSGLRRAVASLVDAVAGGPGRRARR